MKRRPRFQFALIGCLVIAVSAMEISSNFASNKLKAFAFSEAEDEATKIRTLTNATFLSTEWIAHSFLTFFCTSEYIDAKDSSYFKEIIPQKRLEKLNREILEENLKSFIKYNNDFYSAVFVFEPGVLGDAPEGLAISIHSSDPDVVHDIMWHKPFNSKFYQETAESKSTYNSAGPISSDNILAWTTGIPFFSEEDKLLGELWIDTDCKYLSSNILDAKGEKDYSNFIINKDLKIISSAKEESNGRMLKELLQEIRPDDFPQEWYDGIAKRIKSGEIDSFTCNYDGQECITFLMEIKINGFYLVCVKVLDSIYETAKSFKYSVLWITILSLCLLAFCLLFIFRIFQKEDNANRIMEHDLAIASDIQKHFLPEGLEGCNEACEIYGFQKTAKSVGGDLYDYFQKDGKLIFCIGDVSGKGVPAALQMSEICSLFRYIAKNDSNASSIAKALNSAVLERGDNNMICTMFIGILDLANGHLQFCNAGHNPPAIITKDGKAALMNIRPNMPLSAFENYNYQGEEIFLDHSDILFLYTDGVTEARNSNMKFWGEKALVKALNKTKGLSLEAISAGIQEEITRFTSGEDQYDDITILEIKYK